MGYGNSMVNRNENERGIAMIMVITVLVTLVILATAFAPQMERGRARTAVNAARARADHEAENAARYVHIWLRGTHPKVEAMRAARGGDANDPLANPDVDTLAEIHPGAEFRRLLSEEVGRQWATDPLLSERYAYLKRRKLDPLNDDRGSIWSVSVTDAQALINVNGSSPYLLGNLMGGALLSEDVDAGASTIPVSHVTTSKLAGVTGFNPTGGYIRIGGEVIKYESFDGSEFRGCERGVLREVPLKDNGGGGNYRQGAPVIDYSAWKIATHMIASRPGTLSRFRNVEDVHSIGLWGAGGSMDPAKLAQVRHFLTIASLSESAEGFNASQLIVEQLPSSVDGNDPDHVFVRDQQNPTGTTAHYNPGTLVRITDGTNTSYAMVSHIGDGDGSNLSLDREIVLAGRVDAGRSEDLPAIRYDGGEAMISGRVPFPININTASVEVLYANIVNLQHVRSKSDDQIVTPNVAWMIAERIVASRKGRLEAVPGSGGEGRKWRKRGPFRNNEDWGRFLREMVGQSQINRLQEYVLYQNALNPHSHTLRCGTAPWCFRTLDVYHIEARVSINNRAGEQLASTTLRQIVEIGADEITTWTVDSQADFEQRIASGAGAKWVASYPFAATFINQRWAHVQPRKRAPKQIVTQIFPSTSDTHSEEGASTAQDVGDIRLEPVRMQLPGAVVAEHFDSTTYQDGHFTEYDGAYSRKVVDTFRSKSQDHVQPFSMSFWWRSFSEAENWYAFDCGMESFTNRYAIYVDSGDTGPELTFRCAAGTLEQQAAEVFVPLERIDYQPGQWFHIQVFCHGEDPSTMQLLVDGLDVGRRRGFTTLSGGLDEAGTEVQVESTDGFPLYGALKIGREIIEYDLVSGESLQECIRGARGTLAGSYPQGTAVRILGYSLPVTVDVMPGGAGLDERLGKWSALRVTGAGFDDEVLEPIEGTDPPIYITIRGFAAENQAPSNFTVTGLWGQDAETAALGFPTKGYALLGSHRLNFGGGGAGGPSGPAPEDEPLPPGEDPGGGDPQPGGQIPPGARPIPGEDEGDSPDGGGPDIPDGTEPDDGSGDDSGGSGAAGGASGTVYGGWEVVYYERNGTSFTIERYQSTAWQEKAEPYFLVNQIVPPGGEPIDFPSYLIPISVMGGGDATGYLNPGDGGGDQEILQRYYPNADGSARVYLPTGNPEGAGECIRYDSIDSQKAGGGVLFIRDRDLDLPGGIVDSFFDQSQDAPSGSSTGDDPLPDPEPPETPDDGPDVPLPNPGDNPQDPGSTPTDPDADPDGGIPGPGGSVPPGLRDPSDGDDGGDGGDGVPDSSDPADPGTGDPGTDDGSSGSDGGDIDPSDEEPVNPPDDSEGEEIEGDEGGGTAGPSGGIDPGARPGGGGGGGSSDAGGGDSGTGTVPPKEVEPNPDGSGGGDGEEGEEDPDPSGSVPPDLRDPEDPDAPTNTEGTGGGAEGAGSWDPANEPAGPESARLRLQFRGVNGTHDEEHDVFAGAATEESRFMPCFKVWEEHSGGMFHRSGRNDRITITAESAAEGTPDRQAQDVRWADASSNWMCLREFATQRVPAPTSGGDTQRLDLRGRARILKFPCGELPDEMPDDMEFGRSTLANSDLVTAFFDELHIWRHTVAPVGFVVNAEGAAAEATEIFLAPQAPALTLEDITGYDKECGVVLIDGELIIFRGTRVEGQGRLVLERCVRGQFGTKAAFHPIVSYARFLPDVPVSYLEGDLSQEGHSLSLVHTRRWPSEGAARIVGLDGGEIIHYTRRGESELEMPQTLDLDDELSGRGLFRGRFGTQALDHDGDSVVIWQPIRYWDRYTPREAEDGEAFSGIFEHAQTAYVELGSRQRNAYWHNLTWEESLDGIRNGESKGRGKNAGGGSDSGFIDIVVLARFNPNVPWNSKEVIDMRRGASVRSKGSTHRTDVLYVFDDPEEANRLDFEANTAEFRIFFRYKPNAYTFIDADASNLEDEVLINHWKKTPWLQSFSVSYTNRTRVLASPKAGRGR